MPILLRPPPDEREDVSHIQDIQVWSPVLQRSVAVGQVVSGFETVWEKDGHPWPQPRTDHHRFL